MRNSVLFNAVIANKVFHYDFLLRHPEYLGIRLLSCFLFISEAETKISNKIGFKTSIGSRWKGDRTAPTSTDTQLSELNQSGLDMLERPVCLIKSAKLIVCT